MRSYIALLILLTAIALFVAAFVKNYNYRYEHPKIPTWHYYESRPKSN